VTDKLCWSVVLLTHWLQHGSIPKLHQGVHLWCPRKLKWSLRFQNTRERLAQCAWEDHWTGFEPAPMILADSTAVARQSTTRNRSGGSTWGHHQTKFCHPISAHAGASCTTLMGGRLGHVLACLVDAGRFYGRGKTGPNADFCKIRSPKNSLSGPAKRAPAPLGDW
jgi:hypothetical protein